MQVAKIIGSLILSIISFFMFGCTCNSDMAERARAVDYNDYGSLSDTYGYGGYRLEDFMTACGAIVVFQESGDSIVADCNGWTIHIESYEVEPDQTNSFWCTQVLLSKGDLPSTYIFGHVRGAMPRVMTQPEQVLVRDAGLRPWRQKIEKATLEDLIELMNSGNLWEDNNNPLKGLSFSYVEEMPSGKEMVHRPDGQESPVTTGSPNTMASHESAKTD